MSSRYDGNLPPEWDRSDPAGDLVDLSTGTRIRDVEHYGGWVRNGEGTAMRDTDFLVMMDQQRRQQRDAAVASSALLLLF
jgi:hypothetical protein